MTSVINLVRHYQRNIEKCADDEKRVLRCLDKLHQLGVTVHHLQETGVGRTVNALRKEPGEVGTAARALVTKWKHMVASAEDSSDPEDDATDHTLHSGRDSPEDSDHKNVNQSRDGSQVYESDHETGERYTQQYDQTNGGHDRSPKRYQDTDCDDKRNKKVKYSEDSSDESDEKKPDINQIKIKTERSASESQSDDEDEEYSSDSTSEERSHPVVKIEKNPKPDAGRERYREKSSNHSSSERSENNTHQGNDPKPDHSYSTKNKAEARHRSEKDSKKDSENSNKHVERESRKDKELSVSCEKRDKDERSDKQRNSSEKHHRSLDKHKSSDKNTSSSDRNKSSDKSSDKSNSKDKSSSSEKHKSSSHKDKYKGMESISQHKDKSKDVETSSHHKDKSRDRESGLNQKDKSRDRGSSSILKEKYEGQQSGPSRVEKHGKEDNEKFRSSEGSSKSRHSDHSSSHSHKDKKEKKSLSSDNKHKSSSDKVNVDGETKSGDKSSSSTDSKRKSHASSSSKDKDPVPKKKVKIQVDTVDSDDGIDCVSGASFAEALGMVSPVKAKKKTHSKDVGMVSPSNSSSTPSTSNGAFPVPASLLAPTTKLAPLPPLEISALPEISPHYKPRPPPRLLPQVNEDDALNYVMTTKNLRTKVFSGNKTYGKVLSLYELCVNVLQEHIDALEYTGGVPYDILKPVVDRANPEQLFVLEHYNPYLMDDTNHLWQKHCEKKFRNKPRLEMETWREMYLRCQEEQEARLKSLTANIKMAQDARNAPTKQTKMAYVDSVVKPPRNIARKQAIHGTARAAVTSPAARVAALAGAGVVRADALSGRPSAIALAPIPSSSGAFKPKKAPLMQKALQFMRGRKR